MRPPAAPGRGTRGTRSAAGRRTRFPRPKGRTPPVRQTETIAARTRVAPGSRAREGRTTASLSELRTSRVRAPRQASPRSPAARSTGRTSTCGRDVRFGSRIERTPPARGPPLTRSDPGSLSSTTHLRTGSLATTPAPAAPRPNGAHTLADDAHSAHHWRTHGAAATSARTRRRNRYRSVPRARCQDSRIAAAAELIKNDRFRSANCQRRPRARMPVPTSNQGAESKRWLVPLLARSGTSAPALPTRAVAGAVTDPAPLGTSWERP